MDFRELGIQDVVIETLKRQSILVPTPAQEAAFGPISGGQDTIIRAETGSGKTLAYLLPLLTQVDAATREAQVLVLAPTRELAMQIHRVASDVAAPLGIRCMSAIGGADVNRQMEKLKEKPHVIVGSVGRIADLIDRGKLRTAAVRSLVLDEVDEIVGQGEGELRALHETLPRACQTVFASATVGEASQALARAWMREPAWVPEKAATLPGTLSHWTLVVPGREKLDSVRRLIVASGAKSFIVFVNRPFDVDRIVSFLKSRDYAADALTSKDGKQDRRRVIDQFTSAKTQILVCTDLAARGLDFPNVEVVIHYDLPLDAVHYLHRAGRTGRAGHTGVSAVLVEPEVAFVTEKFAKELGIRFEPKMLEGGRVRDAKPAPVQARKQGAGPAKGEQRSGGASRRESRVSVGGDSGRNGRVDVAGAKPAGGRSPGSMGASPRKGGRSDASRVHAGPTEVRTPAGRIDKGAESGRSPRSDTKRRRP